MSPLPLDVARAAVFVATYEQGIADLLGLLELDRAHVPRHLTPDDLAASTLPLGHYGPKVMHVVERIATLTRSQSLAIVPVLAWAYWRGVRDVTASDVPPPGLKPAIASAFSRLTAPTLSDLVEAERVTIATGSADDWQSYAAAAASAFKRATEPTGRASFPSHQGARRG